ncbi:SH3 domain-containing protein [Catelliglobosispora koreensis]|uniref:SH3 domain-containing protein n=1 Tax=Catelliglobosispora koreensis TaxID=129052 RepID=UPI0003A04DEC|nr:SH3 domain-containing protein [Catelliglobosispora koreensis]
MPSKLGSLLAIGIMSVFLGVAVLSAPAVASENATVSDEANVRSRPNTDSAILAVLPIGTPVEVDCWLTENSTMGPRDGSICPRVAGSTPHW